MTDTAGRAPFECPGCGYTVPGGLDRCPSCGRRFETAPGAESAAQEPAPVTLPSWAAGVRPDALPDWARESVGAPAETPPEAGEPGQPEAPEAAPGAPAEATSGVQTPPVPPVPPAWSEPGSQPSPPTPASWGTPSQPPPGQWPPQPPPGQWPPQPPPGQWPPPAAGPGAPGWGGWPPSPPKTDGVAIAALITGLGSLILFFLFLPALAAIVLAIVAAIRVRRSAGARTGRGLAVAGGLLGGVSLTAGVVAVALVASSGLVGAHLVRYSGLQPGDCFDLHRTLGLYRTYSCDHAHDAEIYGRILDPSPSDASWPGAAALSREARLRCPAQLQGYLTGPVDVTRYRAEFLYPLASSWNNGERAIICMIRSADGSKLTASIRSGPLT